MTSSPLTRRTLAPEQCRQLEAKLIAFDRAWHPNGLVEQVRALPPPGHSLRLPTLLEMARIDLEKCWRHGTCPDVESYLRDYPELNTPAAVKELVHAEIEIRLHCAAPLELVDFARRFPALQPQLGQMLRQARENVSLPQSAGKPETIKPGSSIHNDVPSSVMGGDLPEQFGRYRVLRKLGQGGMGAVYLAHDTQLDRQVAIKVPHFRPNDGPDLLERFFREARAAATLQHPNLCPVHDVGTLDGRHYLILAYIEGHSLEEYVRPDWLQEPRAVARLVCKLATALAYAHERGIIHRDLKPSNVMVRKGSEPVVMDFGLARRSAKAEKNLTRTNEIMGTPAYMPPEQAGGRVSDIGPHSDVYSLGVILYQALTGRLPFEGENYMSILYQIANTEPVPPSRLRPEIDPELDAICLKALAKQPQSRHASMAVMAKALTGYLDKSQQAVTRPPPPPPKPKGNPFEDLDIYSKPTMKQTSAADVANAWARRLRRNWPWLAFAVAVILVAGLVIFWLESKRPGQPFRTSVRVGGSGPVPPSKPVNLLVNGSFEDGPRIPNEQGGEKFHIPLSEGAKGIPGWVVTRGPIDVHAGPWKGAHGSRSLDLHGNPGFGGIKQSFNSKPGQRYRVTFFMSGHHSSDNILYRLAVRAADEEKEFKCVAMDRHWESLTWRERTWEFTAKATSTALEFRTTMPLDSDDRRGPLLDDVKVIAVTDEQ